jgi:hypothetical protein
MNFEETIRGLSFYKKGEPIPNPDGILSMENLPEKLGKFLGLASLQLVITRRSLAHIVQKGEIGILLANNLGSCIYGHSSILESDHKPDSPYKRYILFKKYSFNTKDMVVVIEVRENNSTIITAMVADEKYIFKKYKKLR